MSSSIPASRNADGDPRWKAVVMERQAFPMRCLIVDDSASFLAAACRVLEGEKIDVVGVASTIADAIRCFQTLRPDVTLIDIDLGGESGLELAERLHQTGSPVPVRVILISTHAKQDFADVIATSPAVGFLAKSALSPDAILGILGESKHVQEGDNG